jgi:hypothetical protein
MREHTLAAVDAHNKASNTSLTQTPAYFSVPGLVGDIAFSTQAPASPVHRPPPPDPQRCALYTFTSQPLSGDTIINCQRVVFPADVTARVTGTLHIIADDIEAMAGATLDGRGIDGGPGARGASIEGEWSSQTRPEYDAAISACRTNGADSNRGQPGQRGNDGSPGATIVMSHKPRGSLSIVVDGGKGGPGGVGGAGRLLKNGEQNYCDGCTMNCPSGAQGASGADGTKGSVTFLDERDVPISVVSAGSGIRLTASSNVYLEGRPELGDVVLRFVNHSDHWCDFVIEAENGRRLTGTDHILPGMSRPVTIPLATIAGRQLKIPLWTPGMLGAPGISGDLQFRAPASGNASMDIECH